MHGAITPLPNTPSWLGAPLKKAQGELYFTLPLALDGQGLRIVRGTRGIHTEFWGRHLLENGRARRKQEDNIKTDG
jgi:hypothetical protein